MHRLISWEAEPASISKCFRHMVQLWFVVSSPQSFLHCIASRQQGTRTYKKPCRPEPETMNQEPWSLQCFQITCTNCSNTLHLQLTANRNRSKIPPSSSSTKTTCALFFPFFPQLFFVQPLSSCTRSSLATLPHHLLYHVCTKSIP